LELGLAGVVEGSGGSALIFGLLTGLCGGLPLRERIGAPVAVVVLLAFAAFGVDAIIRPQRHMNWYLRRGGDLLRDWNELQVQVFGLVSAGGPFILTCRGSAGHIGTSLPRLDSRSACFIYSRRY